MSKPDTIKRVINDLSELLNLWGILKNMPFPFRVAIAYGAGKIDRTQQQNKLMWMWAKEVATQRGDCDADDVQTQWKLEIGIPILRAADPDFLEFSNAALGHMTYEKRLENMKFVPVTSIMEKHIMIKFLDKVERTTLQNGFTLTRPDKGLAEWMEKNRR